MGNISLAIVCVLNYTIIHLSCPQIDSSSQEYVDAHNAARSQVGVGNITWDASVAAYAQNYANQRMGDCSKLVHSGGPYGENLAWSSGDLSGTAAVNLWVGEKTYYNYTTNSCANGRQCGHYTQVVWLESLRLGCGKVRCNDGGTFINCNYDPPGNYVRQRPY
ncbi:pathogenesis-related protein 1-like [Carya illinoinensis]|uniref:SCP domain-containing protein n=1 Tax=Carya illinoinensis TaxID=32201 RepID=A0A8T1QDP5_CARIL|nr:pathogenesis-related protein 1-like [Carya illinoinensis]KAG6652676.1 hypothetical protein CIPAW_05G022800 [Carya illinoinensis]